MPERFSKLKQVLKTLPDKPGIYQYFDKAGKIIYIGKAKDLKKRVSSYFTKSHDSGKTAVLVKKIEDIKYIVVQSEIDALLLENNLVKKYQPHYNVQLKDDKTFPWVVIKKERFPRVFSTRNVVHDGSEYFGPYPSVKVMNIVLELVRQLYPLRNCNFNLSEDNVAAGKFKVCLEYHIGNCLGPCEGHHQEESYQEGIAAIRHIMKGNINEVKDELKKLMDSHAAALDFEKAQQTKEKFALLERFQAKSTVVSSTIHNVDVFSIVSDERYGYVNYMKVANGAIIQGHTIELKKKLDESDGELLELAIAELRTRVQSTANEIILSILPETDFGEVKITVPVRGDKRKLVELSERNAKYHMIERHKQESLVDPAASTSRILAAIQSDLHLSEVPAHIECFDNSNFQGTNAVAACVVFKNAKPSKKDYRHFNIKTVEGPDDFASMEEVVYRRYKRLLDEEQPLPQLIVVDGGKGQLSAAVKSLEKLELRGKIAVIGIAKKLEEIYFPGDSIPLYINKKSESLKVIQHLRNEAHRFGISHHRNKRSKDALTSELEKVNGIGGKSMELLLRKFKSMKRLKEADFEAIAEVVGKAKAEVLTKYFNA